MRKKCFVIGGGSSLKDFDWSVLKDKDTVVANMAIFSVPDPKYFVTVDYTFYTKLKPEQKDQFNEIKTSKIFIADMSPGTPLIEKDGRIQDSRFNLIYDLQPYGTVIKATGKEGFGYTLGDFRTGVNSGYCALQAAIALGYQEIYLLGFDLNASAQTHFHNQYGTDLGIFRERLDKYYNYFESGLRQLITDNIVNVWSCSPDSRLNGLIGTMPVNLALNMYNL